MLATLRRIGQDLRHRRYIDAYTIAIVSVALAVLSLVGDVVPDRLRWAAVLAGVGLLVLRITIPESSRKSVDEFLGDRFAFNDSPISERLKNAKVIWIFAPSAVNILSVENCEIIRRGALSRPDGMVRVVVLNRENTTAMELATLQLDNSLDFPIQDFAVSLESTMHVLQRMTTWQVIGSFEYGLLDYNPGFSLVAIDPSTNNGRIIVEFHGFCNESTSSRMHIDFVRSESEHWYAYWMEQFNRIWESASHLRQEPSV